MKFKRACLTKPGNFEIFEVDEEPGNGQVLLKIAGCGLCNWELNFWDGNLNFQGYPHKLGHEFTGIVEKVGPNCKKLKVGDRVSALSRGFGGFAEYRVTNESECELVSKDVKLKYAMGEPQKCVVTVLRTAHPEAGDYGVIQGCGPMGLWCIEALKGNLLTKLIAVDIDDEKLKLAKKLGATDTINSKEENVAEKIKELSNGHMADFVIEGTGVPNLLNNAQDYLRSKNGRLVLMSSHHDKCEFDFRKAIDKGIDILVAHPPRSQNEFDDFRRAINLINNHTFNNEPLITNVYSIYEMNKAFRDLANKPKGFIKGVVVVNDID